MRRAFLLLIVLVFASVSLASDPPSKAKTHTLAAPAYIAVLGKVGHPQYVPFQPGMTAEGAIQAAGGMTKGASPKVVIQRKVDGKVESLTENTKDVEIGKSSALALRADDVVNVRAAQSDDEHLLIVGGIILLAIILLTR